MKLLSCDEKVAGELSENSGEVEVIVPKQDSLDSSAPNDNVVSKRTPEDETSDVMDKNKAPATNAANTCNGVTGNDKSSDENVKKVLVKEINGVSEGCNNEVEGNVLLGIENNLNNTQTLENESDSAGGSLEVVGEGDLMGVENNVSLEEGEEEEGKAGTGIFQGANMATIENVRLDLTSDMCKNSLTSIKDPDIKLKDEDSLSEKQANVGIAKNKDLPKLSNEETNPVPGGTGAESQEVKPKFETAGSIDENVDTAKLGGSLSESSKLRAQNESARKNENDEAVRTGLKLISLARLQGKEVEGEDQAVSADRENNPEMESEVFSTSTAKCKEMKARENLVAVSTLKRNCDRPVIVGRAKKARVENGLKKKSESRKPGRSFVDSEDEETDDPAPLPDDSTWTASKASGLDDDSAASSCPSPLRPASAISLEARKLVPVLRSLRRGTLTHFTCRELEELMVQKLCEAISERCHVGELRRRVAALEEEVERWRDKANACAKQARELEVTMEKYLQEAEKVRETGQFVTPIRVHRSVGLQVCLGPAKKQTQSQTKSPQKVKVAPFIPVPPTNKQFAIIQPNPPPNKVLISRQVLPAKPAVTKPPALSAITTVSPSSSIIAKNKTIRTSPMTSTSINDSSVIDLTDDDHPSSSGNKVVGVESKLAYLVPARPGKGGGAKFLIATSPSSLPTPPRLVFNGNTFSRPVFRHPAPLPPVPSNMPTHPSWKKPPPRPNLKISSTSSGIVLSWDMTLKVEHATISSYQLYAYQEANVAPSPTLWREVGDVKALALPMACTLSSFIPGNRYHFSVRAVDVHGRYGPFSFPGSIVLNKS